MFNLFVLIVYAVLITLFFMGFDFAAMNAGGDPQISAIGWIAMALLGIFALGIIVPTLAVIVRRLHDQDKSGWFILIQFIPYVGAIVLLVFMCLDGTKGENRFGADPKGENIADVFA